MWALRSCQYFRFKYPILWLQNFSISLPKYLLPADTQAQEPPLRIILARDIPHHRPGLQDKSFPRLTLGHPNTCHGLSCPDARKNKILRLLS